MIKGASIRLLHQPQPAEAAALMARLRRDGANAISLIPHWYCYLQPGTPNLAAPPAEYRLKPWIFPDVGQDSGHPFQNTPSDDLVLQIALEAQAQGMQVMIKPHLDSFYGAWRGYISVAGYPTRFWTAYKCFLLRYIRIAKQLKEPILCMGTELVQVTKELGPPFWINLAEWVRSRYGGGYNGRLTYAANWGIAGDAEYNRLGDLWPYLDLVSVDAYFPLVAPDAPPSPDFDTMLQGWDRLPYPWAPAAAADMLAMAAKCALPLVFTEIGCGNHTMAAHAPGEDAPDGAERDDRLQADYYRAFRARFESEPLYGGYFNWEMWLGPQADFSHSIIDRPAEDVAFS